MKRKRRTKAELAAAVDWKRVLRIRCQSKRGFSITDEDMEYCMRAYKSDEERYSKMDKEVFEATKPFGSM